MRRLNGLSRHLFGRNSSSNSTSASTHDDLLEDVDDTECLSEWQSRRRPARPPGQPQVRVRKEDLQSPRSGSPPRNTAPASMTSFMDSLIPEEEVLSPSQKHPGKPSKKLHVRQNLTVDCSWRQGSGSKSASASSSRAGSPKDLASLPPISPRLGPVWNSDAAIGSARSSPSTTPRKPKKQWNPLGVNGSQQTEQPPRNRGLPSLKIDTSVPTLSEFTSSCGALGAPKANEFVQQLRYRDPSVKASEDHESVKQLRCSDPYRASSTPSTSSQLLSHAGESSAHSTCEAVAQDWQPLSPLSLGLARKHNRGKYSSAPAHPTFSETVVGGLQPRASRPPPPTSSYDSPKCPSSSSTQRRRQLFSRDSMGPPEPEPDLAATMQSLFPDASLASLLDASGEEAIEAILQKVSEAFVPSDQQRVDALRLQEEVQQQKLSGPDALAYVFSKKIGTLEDAFLWLDFSGTGRFTRVAFETAMVMMHIDIESITGIRKKDLFADMDCRGTCTVSRGDWAQFHNIPESELFVREKQAALEVEFQRILCQVPDAPPKKLSRLELSLRDYAERQTERSTSDTSRERAATEPMVAEKLEAQSLEQTLEAERLAPGAPSESEVELQLPLSKSSSFDDLEECAKPHGPNIFLRRNTTGCVQDRPPRASLKLVMRSRTLSISHEGTHQCAAQMPRMEKVPGQPRRVARTSIKRSSTSDPTDEAMSDEAEGPENFYQRVRQELSSLKVGKRQVYVDLDSQERIIVNRVVKELKLWPTQRGDDLIVLHLPDADIMRSLCS